MNGVSLNICAPDGVFVDVKSLPWLIFGRDSGVELRISEILLFSSLFATALNIADINTDLLVAEINRRRSHPRGARDSPGVSIGRSCWEIKVENFESTQHPIAAPNSDGIKAITDCEGRFEETAPPNKPNTAIIARPRFRLRRAIAPLMRARPAIVEIMPTLSTTLSLVPNSWIAKIFSHFGVWSMNSEPTALIGVSTLSRTAINVAAETAIPADSNPAIRPTQCGASARSLRGADGSVSGLKTWLWSFFDLLKIFM